MIVAVDAGELYPAADEYLVVGEGNAEVQGDSEGQSHCDTGHESR